MKQKTFMYTPDHLTDTVSVGDEVVLVEYTNVLNQTTWWKPRIAPCGIKGNTNPSITRYHGWRGTTNDVSVYAHGVRKVLKVTETADGALKITVGKDLHPDWE